MIFLTALISLEWRRLEKMSRAPKQDNSKKKCHADVATKMERGGSVSPHPLYRMFVVL